jgi:hypothetical protein
MIYCGQLLFSVTVNIPKRLLLAKYIVLSLATIVLVLSLVKIMMSSLVRFIVLSLAMF